MQLESLLQYFQSSSTIKLLRATSAPFVLDFLISQFKSQNRLTISHGEIRASLQSYQERIRDEHPNALREKPDVYLTDWSSPETGWLHRFIELSRTEPSYQLTPSSEAVIAFLERALVDTEQFVGTECRLRLILELLDDVVTGAAKDPQSKLDRLRAQRDRLDAQIQAIEEGNDVESSSATMVRERFGMAISLLNQLQSDFRSVEDRFKQLARLVHHRHAEGRQSRSDILEFALDQEDLLKEDDQGRSFHEFVRLVHSPERQERLAELINQLSSLNEIGDQSAGVNKLHNMMPMLIAEAEKILRTTQRLSHTLRTLLDARSSRHRQQLAIVLRDIQSMAASRSPMVDTESIQIAVDVDLEIQAPMDRVFWSPPVAFATVDMQEHIADDELRDHAFRSLANLNRLDWSLMRARIRRAVESSGPLSLGQLLEIHPPTAGPIEVLGYLQIAYDDGHKIDSTNPQDIAIPDREGVLQTFQIPQVDFVKRHDSIEPI
jgi:Protein of unknown function (DUF3375)